MPAASSSRRPTVIDSSLQRGAGDPPRGELPRDEHHRHTDARLGVRAAEDQVADAPTERARPERAGLAEGVRGGEWRAGGEALCPPVGGRDEVLGLDAGLEAVIAALLERLDDVVAVSA